MITKTHCPDCGAPHPPDAPGGICPDCSLLAALEIPDEGPADIGDNFGTAGSPEPFRPAGETHSGSPEQRNGRFGDYELIEEIARGGMGIIYRARQISLDRIVAVKLLPFSTLTSAGDIKRFRAEASAAAALHHPNIVSVHEVGVLQGQHYLVMNLVNGPTLDRLVAGGPVTPRKAATYVRTIAGAVHYAHEKGILHRDLKPSNVLIDENDQPQVTDFGLAKRLDGESSLTLTGQALGSPGYMPPEQAVAEHGKVTRCSDVYGLGAILYHLLTGRPPFQASTINQAIQQVAERDPLAPNILNPGVPRDLQTICLKCLEKEPDRRYPTAQAVADELGRFLNGEPIRARPVGVFGKTWRWCRRRPVLAGLSLALLLSLAAGLSGVLWQWRRAVDAEESAVKERDRAISAERQAGKERNQAQKLAAEAALEKGQSKLEKGDSYGLFDLVDAYRFAERDTALKEVIGCRWSFWQTEWDRRTLAVRSCWGVTSPDFLQFSSVKKSSSADVPTVVEVYDLLTTAWVVNPLAHDSVPQGQAFSPDGRSLATVTDHGLIYLWDLRTGGLIRPPIETSISELNGIVFSPDGRSLVAYSKQHRGRTVERAAFLRLNDADNQVRILDHRYPIGEVCFSPDGQVLAALCIPDLKLWRTEDLQPIGTPIGVTYSGLLEFNHDGTRLAVNRDDVDGISLLDPRTGQTKQEIPITSSNGDAMRAAFSHDGRRLVADGWDGSLRFWELETPDNPYASHSIREKGRGRISFNYDDSLAAMGDTGGTVRVFNSENGRIRHALHTIPDSEATYLPNGILVTRSYTQAAFWNLDATPLSESTLPDDALAHTMAFDPSGEFLAVGGEGELRLWRMRGSPRIERSVPVSGQVPALTYDRVHKQFVAFVDDGSLLSVDPMTGGTRRLRKLDRGYKLTACISPDARKLAMFRYNETVVADTATGTIEPLGDTRGTRSLCFSPDSQRLAEGRASWDVCLYDASTPPPVLLRKLDKLGGWVLGIAYHPNGEWLAASVEGRVLRLYSADDDSHLIGNCTTTLDRVEVMQFSPDGSLLAAAGPRTEGGYGIELWHVNAHYGLIRAGSILPCTHPVWSLAFSPAEPKLVSGGLGATRVWDLPPAPLNLQDLESRTAATLGFTLNENGQPVISTSPARNAEDIRARLTQKPNPGPTRLDEALRLAPAEALTALQSTGREHPGAIVHSRLEALLHERLIHTCGARGSWPEALTHANAAIRLGRDDPETLCERAFLLWWTGDTEGYQANCQSMVGNFAAAESPEVISYISFAVGLQAGALAEYTGLVDQIRRSIARVGSKDGPAYRFHLGRVLARAGRFAEAVKELEEVDRFLKASGMRVNFDPVVNTFLLSICHARLGRGDAARRWFESAMNDAQGVWEENKPATAENWWFRLLLQRLREEAEREMSHLKPRQDKKE